ncbi:MAG: carbamoyltransferase [Gammaproteobacteria bacterium]|nr:carbamoyltransferase [Gammaproteobacteria bacterium]
MNILGLNYFYHDSSACLVQDGVLTVAIEEERLTRKKHTYSFPFKAIDRCLQVANITPDKIDAIAVSVKPELDWFKRLVHGISIFPKSVPFFKYEILLYYWKQKEFRAWVNKTWPQGSKRPAIHFIPHHLTHAAGTFFVSPYESAAILSIDGSGEWASSMLGHGHGNEVKTFSSSYFPMSLGSVYEAVTDFCGFKPCYDEGKTMGLAPMGDPEVFKDKVERIITVDAEGHIHVDTSYFTYQYWAGGYCSDKFYREFGKPRKKGLGPFDKHHLDVAAAFQHVLEESCLQLAKILKDKTKEKYLIIAGGVALNSVMNGRVIRESAFDDVYVMPAAGDNGTAIGAAYYVLHGVHNEPRKFVHDNPYVGTEYSNEEIKSVLDECKLNAEYHDDIEAVTAKLLHDGEILCWFQGKMEIGPRALGNRSILANPTLPTMKDKINAEVKHREAYRPFAPSATVECKNEYFDLTVEDPFMLKVCHVLPEKRDVLPAITHVDGTARLQTVRKELNPRYHKLLTEFGKLSGVPVLLNTSFNIMDEPIVESPLQAIRCFFTTGLDKLVIGNYLIKK